MLLDKTNEVYNPKPQHAEVTENNRIMFRRKRKREIMAKLQALLKMLTYERSDTYDILTKSVLYLAHENLLNFYFYGQHFYFYCITLDEL